MPNPNARIEAKVLWPLHGGLQQSTSEGAGAGKSNCFQGFRWRTHHLERRQVAPGAPSSIVYQSSGKNFYVEVEKELFKEFVGCRPCKLFKQNKIFLNPHYTVLATIRLSRTTVVLWQSPYGVSRAAANNCPRSDKPRPLAVKNQ